MAEKMSIGIGVKIDDIAKVKESLNSQLKKLSGLKVNLKDLEIDEGALSRKLQTKLNLLSKNVSLKIDKIDISDRTAIKSQLNTLTKDVALKINKVELGRTALNSIQSQINTATQNMVVTIGNIRFNVTSIDTLINRTRQATQEAKQYQNVMGKSLDIGDGAKAFNEMQKKAKEIRNTVDSLAKISFTTGKNGGIDTATLSYTDNLGKLVTETMGWKQVTTDAGKTVKNIFTTLGTTVTDNIAQMNKLEEKVASIKSKMQGKLTASYTNGAIDSTALDNLQTRLNAINTKTQVSEIRELQTEINKLGGSENTFAKLKQTIQNMTESLAKIRGNTNSDILGLSSVQGQILAYETQLNHLKTIMQDVISGKSITSFNVNAELETMSNSSKKLSSTLQEAKTQADGLSVAMRNGLQSKLNTAFNNGFIDTSFLTRLQQGLNSINANTATTEIARIKDSINNLGKTDGNIVKLQKTITNLTNDINKMKDGKKLDLMTSEQLGRLSTAQSQVNALRTSLNNVKAGKVVDGQAISSQVNIATNSVKQLKGAIDSTTVRTLSLVNVMKSMSTYLVGGSAIYFAINQLKQGLSAITSVDTALRNLKRVSDEVSNTTLNNFVGKANELGISLGKTTEDAINATTTFKQLGYTFKEASEYMANNSLILSNVGDMSAEDSANSLVSILKAFKLEAKETTGVVDILNETGNRFAITTGQLTEGLRIGGASLAIANNDLRESTALISTGTEILRDSNLVANGLKTISINKKLVA